MEVPEEDILWMYEKMYKIRTYENKLKEIYYEGKKPDFDISAGPIPGELHLSAGQEPVAVGCCIHLREDDVVVGTHRAHHFAIAKGVDLKKMTAEIFGKKTGLSKGKGGHMHLFDPAVNFCCSGIVGASWPPSVGGGLAANMKNEDFVSVSFGGEGASNQGTFHESLNLASVWNLPVIFIIEDNKWSISVPKEKSTTVEDSSVRAKGYDMPGHRIEDNDVLEIYRVCKEAVERARNGNGPTLIEIETYRYFGHFEGDPQVYRPDNEVERLKENDPIDNLEAYLLDNDISTEEDLEEIREEKTEEIEEAIEYARESDYPDVKEAYKDVYSEGGEK